MLIRSKFPNATGLAVDSRQVNQGDIFFALQGVKADGASFIESAIAKGAVGVVSEQVLSLNVPTLKVENARLALAMGAREFFPHQPQTCVAITGTSGKSSVASFTRQIFHKNGFEAASVGTVGIEREGKATYGTLTTPDPITLHKTLDSLSREGVTHLAFEASSHGLDQFRLDGVALKAAAFTNLSRDHLDYHPTMAEYARAKLRLFELLPANGTAVVVKGEYSKPFEAAAGSRLLSIGSENATLTLVKQQGIHKTLRFEGETYEVQIPHIGAFQVMNILTACALAIGTGLTPKQVFQKLETLKGAPGRMENVGQMNGAPVLIDYAHKPDALLKALEALRPETKGRIILVFGCGGDRDKGKRPIMGSIAQTHADIIFVTDDNPRSETPSTIRQEILNECPKAHEIADRATAIEAALAQAKQGDIVLIAGKGHEEGQIIKGVTYPFSDKEVALKRIGKAL
jgi:UDP-N-acetylmuramoyl-L-alanyl-D-glutamate--2,6-diaminopimelate ligase